MSDLSANKIFSNLFPFKWLFSLLFAIILLTSWSTPSFAVRQLINNAGAPIVVAETGPGANTGEAEGVDITGAGVVTLTVGAGQNIFNNNSLGGVVVNAALDAVSTDTADNDQITFAGSSNVFGKIGCF